MGQILKTQITKVIPRETEPHGTSMCILALAQKMKVFLLCAGLSTIQLTMSLSKILFWFFRGKHKTMQGGFLSPSPRPSLSEGEHEVRPGWDCCREKATEPWGGLGWKGP